MGWPRPQTFFAETQTEREVFCQTRGSIGMGDGGTACAANNVLFEHARGNKEKTKTLEMLAYGKVVSVKIPHGVFVRHAVLELQYRGETKKAIFKFNKHGDDPEDRELAATVFSEMLGFGVTPLGLERTIPFKGGRYTGFIQEFIDGTTLESISKPYDLLASPQYAPRYNLITLFDLFIQNHDRARRGGYSQNLGNWMMKNDGTLYAIDHERSAFNPDYLRVIIPPLEQGGEIPVEAAHALIASASKPEEFLRLASFFPFITEDVKIRLLSWFQVIANSIVFKRGKAFVIRGRLVEEKNKLELLKEQ